MTAPKRDLAREIAWFNDRMGKTKRIIVGQEDLVKKATGKIRKFQSDLQEDWHRLKVLTELQVVENGLPENISILRSKIAQKIKHASRRDITIEQKESLERELVVMHECIRRLCQHPFVIGYPGFEGSQSNDFDDAHHGARLCLVCSFGERDSGSIATEDTENGFSTLQKQPGRIVKRTDMKIVQGFAFLFGGISKIFEIDLVVILNLFDKKAGCDWVDWPKEMSVSAK